MYTKGSSAQATAIDAKKVIASLQSFETVTQQSLHHLETILCLEPTENGSTRESGSKTKKVSSKPPNTHAKSSNAPKSTRRPPKAGDFKIYEEPETSKSIVSNDSRKKIATEAFNASLKLLSKAAKERLTSKKETCRKSDELPLPLPQQTRSLQPRSPNRQQKEETSACPRDDAENILITAQCAQISLQSLRQSCTSAKRDKEAARNEQAALILLDKLITLGLEHFALKEAAVTRKLYEIRHGADEQVSKKIHLSDVELGDLLVTAELPASKSDFDFVTAFQSQILRLAILQGSCALQEKLVKAVELETRGGPSYQLLCGHHEGYIDAEKAGTQLRTLSQALFKLLSLSQNASKDKSASELNLGLCIVALCIRIKSWSLLGHKADLHQELWVPILQCLKSLWRIRSIPDNVYYDRSKASIRQLQDCLESSGLSHAPSDEVLKYMSKLADLHGKAKDVLEYTVNTDSDGTLDTIVKSWKVATIELNHLRDEDSGLPAVQKALDGFENDISIDHPSTDVLIHGVRLRKACSGVIAVAEEQVALEAGSKASLKLQACAVRIIFSFTQLMVVNISTFATIDSQASREKETTSASAITVLAKTIEAVLEAEKCRCCRSGLLQEECDTSLRACSSVVEWLIQHISSTPDATANMKYGEDLAIRLSNVVWMRSDHPWSSEGQNVRKLALMRHSIDILKGLCLEQKQRGALGVKLQKLGQFYEGAGAYTTSLQAYEEAIEHYIQAGALADAVETALTSSAYQVWSDDKTLAAQLGQALFSRLRVISEHGVSESSSTRFYDSQKLPSIHRAVLLEKQIHISVQSPISSSIGEGSVDYVSRAYNLCTGDEYSVYRLRLTSHLLKFAAKFPHLGWTKVIDNNLIEEACTARNSKSEHFLRSFEASLRHLVRIQWALVSASHDVRLMEAQILTLNKELGQIEDKKSLEVKIDDIELLLNVLSAALDLSSVRECYELSISILNLQAHVLRQTSRDPKCLVTCLLRLVSYLNLCDDSLAAKKCLEEAESLAISSCPPQMGLQIAFGKVEHYLNTSEVDRCSDVLEQASLQHKELLKSQTSTTSRTRTESDSVVAFASLLSSMIAFRRGDLCSASVYARQSVKLTTSLWAYTDSLSNSDTKTHMKPSMCQNAPTSSDMITIHSTGINPAQIQGSSYWQPWLLHIRALSNIAFLSVQNGLHSDAVHYYEQAHKMAKAASSTRWISRIESVLGLTYSRAGQREKAYAILSTNIAPSGSEAFAIDSIHLLHKAEAFLELGEIDSARKCLARVPERKSSTNCKTQSMAAPKNPKQPSKAQRIGSKPRTISGTARRSTKKQEMTSSMAVKPPENETFLTYQQLELEHLRLAIQSLLSLKTDHKSSAVIDVSANDPSEKGCTSLMQQNLATVNLLLSLALKKLADNSVTSVLSETAVALPVKYKSNRRSGRVSFVQAESPQMVNPSGKAKIVARAASDPVFAARELLMKAHAIVCSIRKSKESFCSSMMVHVLHRLEAKIALLSSTMDAPFTYSSTELVLRSLMPKDITRIREQFTVVAENATRERAQLQSWCSKSSSFDHYSKVPSVAEEIDFDLIPQNWSIVSIALTDDQQELLVSKVVKGRSPFLLRIPLSRSTEVEEEEDFSFVVAKDELLSLVNKANKTAHDKRGQGDREARRVWYAEREDLDRQMDAWLNNVENIWLGGFKGLLTTGMFDENLTATFGQSLAQTLNNHLPSRQKAATGKVDKIELHAHVLELFLGLGSPQLQDLDEAIMDLLYFVIDILQFNGEQNAYDEIDWDAMLLEVLDALTSYHSRVSVETPSTRHTILILDKELQVFPWESLPCLRTQPVSRMPSLGAIFERLPRIRSQSSGADGYTINGGNKGAYILNPSSDLVSTQSAFEPILQTYMHDYTSMINKPPSEDQFESMLTSHELFLYFGHGSGAQYVRGRTIRKLDKCAVALLMGCSSAKMTECGKFESYGMPGYYSLGGSMAVVGTLWDVTDRDIDRFALSTMVEWGLVPSEDAHVKEVLSRSSKKTKISPGENTRTVRTREKAEAGSADQKVRVALDEAIMKSRESCLLRFLNGAAPVIYGLPVYLE